MMHASAKEMAGLDDIIADKVAEAVFGSAKLDPNAPGTIARQEFYSSVLAKTGQKFVVSDEGKAAIQKFTIYSFVPGLVIGAIAGYWLAGRFGR